MGTGKPRISTAAQEPGGRVVQVELAPGRGLAELGLGQVAVLELETAPVVELTLAIDLVAAPELETAPVVELTLAIDLVAELAPEIDPVVAALERGPVVAAVERDQAVAELEPDQAEAVLAPGHPRGQPGVAPTKSAIAAHRRGLVPLLAAEDLAAAAETTREPAAAEAVIAWEVAE